jgi:hypothetical protein
VSLSQSDKRGDAVEVYSCAFQSPVSEHQLDWVCWRLFFGFFVLTKETRPTDAVLYSGSFSIRVSDHFNINDMRELVFVKTIVPDQPKTRQGPPPLVIDSVPGRAVLDTPNGWGDCGLFTFLNFVFNPGLGCRLEGIWGWEQRTAIFHWYVRCCLFVVIVFSLFFISDLWTVF